jgi:glycosyltransferase involved in cell wall biosynthesis
MPRILHVIQSIDPRGGGPIAGIHELRQADSAYGHEILSLDDPASELVRSAAFVVSAVGPAGFLGHTPRLVPWLKAHGREYRLIVIHGLWRFHSVGSWLALREIGVPYLVQPHGMLDPWFNERYPLKRIKKAFFWRWTEYRVLRDAKGVVFTCQEERERSRQAFAPYSCRELVVPYGISHPPISCDPEKLRSAFLDRFPDLKRKRLILYLSRIHPKKGCDLLIEAFARECAEDPSLHLVMAGPDQVGWRRQLKGQASRLGIADRITWPDMLLDDLKWGAYHAAEVFVLPSHHENFGIVVVEALACGTPVLISRGVQIWREIEAAGACLTDTDDVDGTRRLIRRWLALSEIERQAFATAAQSCFRTTFEAEDFVKRWNALARASFDQPQEMEPAPEARCTQESA